VAGGGTTVDSDDITPSGVATWTRIGRVHVNRRSLYCFRGDGPFSAGTISITFTSGNGSTFTEFAWSVNESTGQDATPNDAVVTNSAASGTTSAAVDPGTPGVGDAVMYAVIHETAENVALEASLTQLSEFEAGTDLRSLHVGYDVTATLDESPTATWASSSSNAVLAFVINVGAGGATAFPHHYYQQMRR
jgi:hypothetical protein